MLFTKRSYSVTAVAIAGLALASLVFNACSSVKATQNTAGVHDTLQRNPVIKNKYTADPAAMVYKDKVYLYTGHDVAPPEKNFYEMHEWLCFSSSDMVNWTEHPSPLNVKEFKWARDDAWASQ